MIKQYILYLIRWQLSTPVLACCILLMKESDPFISTVVSNLIGGLIFFWVDRLIFRKEASNERQRD